MDAVAAADAQRVLVLEGAAAQHGEQRVEIGEEDVARLLELKRQAGVEHVARGQALMEEPRLGSDMLGEVGEEGDDVVPGLALDLVDARDLELAFLAQRRGDAGGNDAGSLERLGGEGLDLEPDAVAVLRLPDRAHLRPAVARDHGANRIGIMPSPKPARGAGKSVLSGAPATTATPGPRARWLPRMAAGAGMTAREKLDSISLRPKAGPGS